MGMDMDMDMDVDSRWRPWWWRHRGGCRLWFGKNAATADDVGALVRRIRANAEINGAETTTTATSATDERLFRAIVDCNERGYVKERKMPTDSEKVYCKTESARGGVRRLPSENATSLCPSGQKSDTNRIEKFVTVCGGQRRV